MRTKIDGQQIKIDSNRYINMINKFLVDELTKFSQNYNFWFKQDGTKSHTTRISINATQQIFGNPIISNNGDIH